MADSIHKRVMDAVLAALGAQGAPAVAYRTRTESFAAAQMPAFNVFPTQGTADEAGNTVATLEQRVSFAVAALASGTSDVDVTLDPLFVWAWQKILADTTLGGLVLDVQLESYHWTFPAADTDIASCTMNFAALVTTLRADPTASGLNQ